MEQSKHFSFSTSVASHALAHLLDKTFKDIQLLQFARKNQPAWILKSQENTLNSNFKFLALGPQASPTKLDQQPKHILPDTLTSTCADPTLVPTLIGLKGSIGSFSKAPSVKKSKHSQNSIVSGKTHSKLREQVAKKFEEVERHPLDNGNEDEYVQRLRQYKIEEQTLILKNKPTERKTKECKLQKNEEFLFDYEGNFAKRKGNKVNQFKYNNLKAKESPDKGEVKKRSVSQNISSKGQSVVVINRVGERRKGDSQMSNKQVVFGNSNKKDDMLRSIQINNPGVKITVDGEVSSKDRSKYAKPQNSRASQKVKTVQMRRNSFENNQQRFKTQVTLGNIQSNRELPSTKRVSAQRRRIQTQSSHYSGSKTQKISVENYLLKKMVLQSGQDLESSYIRIPSKQKMSKRIKTNADSDVLRQSSQIDSLKIKEKLQSMTKQGDRLPKILSHYKQAESQILKEMRKKNLF